MAWINMEEEKKNFSEEFWEQGFKCIWEEKKGEKREKVGRLKKFWILWETEGDRKCKRQYNLAKVRICYDHETWKSSRNSAIYILKVDLERKRDRFVLDMERNNLEERNKERRKIFSLFMSSNMAFMVELIRKYNLRLIVNTNIRMKLIQY